MSKTEVKKQIKIITLKNKWENFVYDNSDKISMHVMHSEPKYKADDAWNFATDLFFDELSEEYDSEMLEKRFEEDIFDEYWSHFFDELFQALTDNGVWEDD